MNPDPDLLALARRAQASPRFRWMEGMLTTGGCRLIGQERHGLPDHGSEWACADPVDEGATVRYVWPVHMVGDDWLPDLSDPCTVGGLLVLVRDVVAHALAAKLHIVLNYAGPQRATVAENGELRWEPAAFPAELRATIDAADRVRDLLVEALSLLAHVDDPLAGTMAVNALVAALEAAPEQA